MQVQPPKRRRLQRPPPPPPYYHQYPPTHPVVCHESNWIFDLFCSPLTIISFVIQLLCILIQFSEVQLFVWTLLRSLAWQYSTNYCLSIQGHKTQITWKNRENNSNWSKSCKRNFTTNLIEYRRLRLVYAFLEMDISSKTKQTNCPNHQTKVLIHPVGWGHHKIKSLFVCAMC